MKLQKPSVDLSYHQPEGEEITVALSALNIIFTTFHNKNNVIKEYKKNRKETPLLPKWLRATVINNVTMLIDPYRFR